VYAQSTYESAMAQTSMHFASFRFLATGLLNGPLFFTAFDIRAQRLRIGTIGLPRQHHP
jgi:hypothetical protein